MSSPPSPRDLDGLVEEWLPGATRRPDVMALLEPYREDVERLMDDFDEETQSWRDYATCIWGTKGFSFWFKPDYVDAGGYEGAIPTDVQRAAEARMAIALELGADESPTDANPAYPCGCIEAGGVSRGPASHRPTCPESKKPLVATGDEPTTIAPGLPKLPGEVWRAPYQPGEVVAVVVEDGRPPRVRIGANGPLSDQYSWFRRTSDEDTIVGLRMWAFHERACAEKAKREHAEDRARLTAIEIFTGAHEEESAVSAVKRLRDELAAERTERARLWALLNDPPPPVAGWDDGAHRRTFFSDDAQDPLFWIRVQVDNDGLWTVADESISSRSSTAQVIECRGAVDLTLHQVMWLHGALGELLVERHGAQSSLSPDRIAWEVEARRQNERADKAEAELTAERALRHKQERNTAEAFREVEARERALRAELAAVKTDVEDVWRWVGDGSDHPESLSCPVVMRAETLRELLNRVRPAADGLPGEIELWTDGHPHRYVPTSLYRDAVAHAEEAEAAASGRDEFRRGVEAAAAVADQYNASSTHPFQLGDCILGKLNQLEGEPRQNNACSPSREHSLIHVALHLIHSHGDEDSTNARIALRAALAPPATCCHFHETGGHPKDRCGMDPAQKVYGPNGEHLK